MDKEEISDKIMDYIDENKSMSNKDLIKNIMDAVGKGIDEGLSSKIGWMYD